MSQQQELLAGRGSAGRAVDAPADRWEDAGRAPPTPGLAWVLLGIVVLVVGGGGVLVVRLLVPPSRGLAPTEVKR
jgi:hypothetical protein